MIGHRNDRYRTLRLGGRPARRRRQLGPGPPHRRRRGAGRARPGARAIATHGPPRRARHPSPNGGVDRGGVRRRPRRPTRRHQPLRRTRRGSRHARRRAAAHRRRRAAGCRPDHHGGRRLRRPRRRGDHRQIAPRPSPPLRPRSGSAAREAGRRRSAAPGGRPCPSGLSPPRPRSGRRAPRPCPRRGACRRSSRGSRPRWASATDAPGSVDRWPARQTPGRAGLEAVGHEQGGQRDHAVHHDRHRAGRGLGVEPGHGGDLEAAHLREQDDGVGDAGDAAGARRRPAAPCGPRHAAEPRLPARPPRRAAAGQRADQARGGGGVADAHVAGDEQVATGGDARLPRTPPRRRPR